jgi:nucleoside-diphosphate-sugar epimerase
MGFVAKLSAAAPSDAFLRLRTTHRSGNHAEPMLKVRDSETGLWSAFYLRAAAGAQIRSDPYRRSFAFLAETSRAGKRLAALPHLRDADFLWQACENQLGVALPSNHAHVLVVNEQEALGQGTVAASADGRLVVDWRLSDEVEGAIRRNLDRLAAYTGATLTLPDGSLRDRLWSAAHHSGTCRISADVETGVIDADLRVHGAQHVYVCDGSILPSTGASNTGLTIAALAHRLAERLNGERRFSAASPTQGRLLISGATGAVGRMMRSRLADLDIDWHELDLRHPETGTSTRPGAGVLLHLANAHQSVADNVKLQERAAAAMAAADIEQVIVPMSAATFESTGPAGPKSTAENFGFTYAGTDSYSVGKLAAERFWLDWQAAKPGRTLALIYVPTIMGPRSQWTRKIANHAPDKILIVPQLERLLAVSETDLVEGLARLAKDGVADGVSRHFVLSPSTSLAQSILSDRGHGVTVLRLPRPVWSMMEFSGRSPLIDKALTAARTVADRMLRPFGYAIVPISARYLDLFRRQSDMAATIEAAAQSSRADYRCG